MFHKECGGLTIEISGKGLTSHDYENGCLVRLGHLTTTLSVDELRDLQYLLGRALSAADRHRHLENTKLTLIDTLVR